MKYRIHRYRNMTTGSAREERIAHFHELLIRINQLMVTTTELSALFQSVCDLIVELGRFRLASIAVPKADGTVRLFGMAGATGYLEQVMISIDPNIPEGRGPLGTAWREDRPVYNASFQEFPHMASWANLAEQYGLRSSAALPVRREGVKWGVLIIYHGEGYIFDEDMRTLVETLALDIANGIDRIDLEELHRHYTDHTALGMAMMMQDRIVNVNRQLVDMLGYAHKNELVGQSFSSFFLSDSEQEPIMYPHEILQQLEEMPPIGFAMMRKDGRRIWVEVSVSVLRERHDQIDNVAVWTIQEVTERYRLQQQLEHAAMYDMLTELPNRRALEMKLAEAIQQARQKKSSVIVGLIDLDNFRFVNDTYGHDAGDRVLKEFTCRLQAYLGTDEFLARWGGDEMVVIFQNECELPNKEDISLRINALYQVVAYPIEVMPDQEVMVDMSMGVAVYPTHGVEGDQLVRLADLAMYQVKTTKWARDTWWQWGVDEIATGSPLPNIVFPIKEMVDSFFDQMVHEPGTSAIFENLSEDESNRLKVRLRKHLEFLLHHRSTDEDIQKRAIRFGEIHALVGVNGGHLSQSAEFFSKIITEVIHEQPLSVRHALHSLLQHRIQKDLQTQLQAHEQTILAYWEILHRPLSFDSRSEDLEALGRLPGIVGVLLIRLHSQEGFFVEMAAGDKSAEIVDVLMTAKTRAVPYLVNQEGQSLLAEAWLSATIQSTPAYQKESRFQIRREVFRQIGVRSVAAIPLLDEQHHSVAVVELYGSYPNQFESKWMKVFLQGVQRWGEERWARFHATKPLIAADKMRAYRSLLFSGGFRLYMQPIVELRSGHVLKFEALARLQDENGNVIPPGQFIPILGESELERLFQLGFEEAVRQLSQWGKSEKTTKISLNLSPTTIQQSNLVPWIQAKLEHYQCPPDRLILEVLETTGTDLSHLEDPLKQLAKLGIPFAIDDFGSGDSNFLRLATLPFKMVKLDRRLLEPMHTNPQSVLILLGSLIQIGSDFGWDIVIEGLETFEVVEAVFRLGARYGQGYYFSRPMPMEQVLEWKSQFSFSLSNQLIITRLGALAYLVNSLRVGRKKTPSEEQCPITRFFREQGWGGSVGMALHHQIHQGDQDPNTYKQLLNWVEDKVIKNPM